jgi:hypothetical protein
MRQTGAASAAVALSAALRVDRPAGCRAVCPKEKDMRKLILLLALLAVPVALGACDVFVHADPPDAVVVHDQQPSKTVIIDHGGDSGGSSSSDSGS